MTDSTETKICDYLAEKDEQRLGVNVDDLIEGRYKAVFDKMEEVHADFPELDAAALERRAVCDCLFDVETAAIRLKLYASSIMHLVDGYVEDCGTDVPPEIEMLQLSMWHLADDCERFESDFDGVRLMASRLIEHPRI